jgi:hypothetical protein
VVRLAAFSSAPPFSRYAVIPAVRNVWLPIFVSMCPTPPNEIRRRADAAGVQPWPESARSLRRLVLDSLSRHMRASARRRAGLAAAI